VPPAITGRPTLEPGGPFPCSPSSQSHKPVIPVVPLRASPGWTSMRGVAATASVRLAPATLQPGNRRTAVRPTPREMKPTRSGQVSAPLRHLCGAAQHGKDAVRDGRQSSSGTVAAWHVRVAAPARGAKRGVISLELVVGAWRPSLGHVIQGCWAHCALRAVDPGSCLPPGAVDSCQQRDRPGRWLSVAWLTAEPSPWRHSPRQRRWP
jgi:hypothetical protein